VPLVLAIEPDLRQAAIVKRIVRERVLADVAVVDSPDTALQAIRTTMPDVLLISALLSPRDEDELIAHLRTLADADHLQTHTIPQLASSLGPGEGRASRGLLSAFRRKKEPESVPAGCDPDIFAEEIRSYLQRAAEQKRERLDARGNGSHDDRAWRVAAPGARESEPIADAPVEAAASSWASPFEWKPSTPSSAAPAAEARVAEPEPVAPAVQESLMAHLRPPAGILTVDKLADTVNMEPVAITEPLIASSSPLAPDVEPPIVYPAPIVVEEPPVVAAAPAAIEEPIVLAPPPVAIEEPIVAAAAPVAIEPPPVPAAPAPAPRVRAGRSKMKDSGLGIRDQRAAIRDPRLGALASWVRSENNGRDVVKDGDEVRGLLTSLAVPAAVVAVGYGRGCRIRRVRVPAAREPHESEAVGAVILSKRALAERRERREHSA